MLNTLRIDSIRNAGLRATVAALLLAGSSASLAATYDLCATSGTAVMPGTGESVTVLGYGTYANGLCSVIAAPGGPVLEVEAGSSLTVNLHNGLAGFGSTGIVFQGQAMPPDLAGAAAGSDKSYTFTPTAPGTYLYQAAPLTNAEHQTAMGLYGALIVRPAGVAAPYSRTDSGVVLTNDATTGKILATDAALTASDVGASVSGAGIPPGTTIESIDGSNATLSSTAVVDATISMEVSKSAGQAYGAGTTFDEESTLVLSEIDPALNNSAAPGAFDMRDIAPRYFLINGKAYPETLPIASGASHKLLLRYVNAGVKHHSMGLLGLRQQFIAKDGSVLPTADVAVTAETLASGQTGDALVTIPAVTTDSKFALYDASLNLHNSSDQGIGGMLTFVTAGAGTATAGPAASAASATPSPTNGSVDVVLSAKVGFAGSTGLAAEYFVDAQGAGGSGTTMTVSGTTVTATVAAATLAGLGSGSHTFYIHGSEGGVWGSYASTVLNLDKTGPATSALALSPNPSSGAVAVTLSASASDVDTGGANINAVEYSVNGGAPVTMTLGTAGAPVSAATATIAGGTCTATCTVSVRSQDALGNWGAPVTTNLVVSTGGPATSNVQLWPSSANNGSFGVSSGQPVLRITAAVGLATGAATAVAAEGYINVAAAAIDADTAFRGFPFVPADGAWNAASEGVSADVPLANIASLLPGSYPVCVRGKDSTGAWGKASCTNLLIDKSAPNTSATGSVSPTAVAFGGTVTLTFSATDPAPGASGIAAVLYWFDSATAPANPRVALATSAGGNSYTAALNLANLGGSGGTHTVFFKARDAAGNVSANQGKTSNNALTVVQARPDTYRINGNNNASQTGNVNANNGVLSNDLPNGGNRTATPASPTVNATGGGGATMSVSLNANGSFSYTLTAPGTATTNQAIRAAKRGTYTFTYTFTRGGISTDGTATIIVR